VAFALRGARFAGSGMNSMRQRDFASRRTSFTSCNSTVTLGGSKTRPRQARGTPHKTRHQRRADLRLLYPQKRTSFRTVAMSALCHNRKSAVAELYRSADCTLALTAAVSPGSVGRTN
jgi:hypothetical protein